MDDNSHQNSISPLLWLHQQQPRPAVSSENNCHPPPRQRHHIQNTTPVLMTTHPTIPEQQRRNSDSSSRRNSISPSPQIHLPNPPPSAKAENKQSHQHITQQRLNHLVTPSSTASANATPTQHSISPATYQVWRSIILQKSPRTGILFPTVLVQHQQQSRELRSSEYLSSPSYCC